MIDIKLILSDPDGVKAKLAKKGCDADLGKIVALDAERRALIAKNDELKNARNKASAEVPKLKKEGKDVSELIARTKVIGQEISEGDKRIAAVEGELNDLVCRLPNLPDDDVVGGGKEANEVVKVVGKKPEFGFEPLDHVALCTKHGLIDYERGVKLSGSGHWIYRGMGARLEWALLNFFVSEHLADGYEFILPPLALGYGCGYGSGQFPKFRDEVYWVEDPEAEDRKKQKFMLPTAETALVNLYAGEILKESELPKKLFAYTPCFRKEAGSYRSEERGMIRGHQFNKVEMVQITTPENSKAAFEELVGKACSLVEKLGLHFRLSKLAAGDCSASMARTYDIEVWIPSMGIYKEVSSVSNANDYQARRNGTRYKSSASGKNEFVHTLNGSGLATSRVLPAIVEQYQQADGSIVVPEVLRKYVGTDVIK